MGSSREALEDEMYKAVLGRMWHDVVEIYKEHPEIRGAKMTKLEDTALHAAITLGAPENIVHQLLDAINNTTEIAGHALEISKIGKSKNVTSMDEASEAIIRGIHGMQILGAKNKRGNTPLHFAASRGSPIICYALMKAAYLGKGLKLVADEWLKEHVKDADEVVRINLLYMESLDSKRNDEGETPLYLAALGGHKQTFLLLHSIFIRNKDVNVHPRRKGRSMPMDASTPWRKNGGDTILHSTIQRQYFDLSLLVIHLFKDEIAYSANEEGYSPLHTLASIPSAFRSGTRLAWWHQLLYKYIHVDKLEFDDNFIAIDVGDFEYDTNKLSKDDAPAESHRTQGSLRKVKERHVWARQIMEQLLKRINYENEYNEDEIARFQHLSDAREQEILISKEQEKNNAVFDVDQAMNKIMRGYEKKEQRDPVLKCILEAQIHLLSSYKHFAGKRDERRKSALLIAAKHGLVELVQNIINAFPLDIHERTPTKKRNIVLVAAKYRQPDILKLIMKNSLWLRLREAVDVDGNNALHLAAMLPQHMPWEIPGSAMQMQWEVKWFEYVKENMPAYFNSQRNNDGKTPKEIFAIQHKELVKKSNMWLKDTSSSYSIVAALAAGVTYSTSSTVPGGSDEKSGKPTLQHTHAFKIFSISALVSFCFSVTSLAAFLAIYSSRMQPKDFRRSLPLKLFLGLTSLFICIITMLISFGAAHSTELEQGNNHKVDLWYSISLIPLCFYAIVQIPLYCDLLRASFTKVPKPNQVGEDIPL